VLLEDIGEVDNVGVSLPHTFLALARAWR
jgi:hypothetical protein